MNKTLQIAVTIFCTFTISNAFAQCRPGSPCHQGGGYSYYGDQQQQPPQGQYYRQQQPTGQSQGQVHPTGEPSHYYKGLPVYMEGDAPPPPGADIEGPRGKNAVTPSNIPSSGQQSHQVGK